MKALGYLLISVGFLAGSVLAVQTEDNVIPWGLFAPALIVGVAGVALARIGARRETHHEDSLTANLDALGTSIERIVENITRLDGEKERLHPYDVHGRIDELFPEDLSRFVEARESIGHVYGLQEYADVMNDFAAGERYLNRVWSASVDCYIDEVKEYIGRARHQFEEVRRKLLALTSGMGK